MGTREIKDKNCNYGITHKPLNHYRVVWDVCTSCLSGDSGRKGGLDEGIYER